MTSALKKAKENKPEFYGLNEKERVETTFMQDFYIACAFGKNAIESTYKRVKEEWLPNPAYWTECVIALNNLCWMFYNKGENQLSQLFAELYYRGRDDFYDFYDSDCESDKEARDYYFNVTD